MSPLFARSVSHAPPSLPYARNPGGSYHEPEKKTGVAAVDVVAVDLDGDGHLDLVVGPVGDTQVVLLNDGRAAFVDGPRAYTATQQTFVVDLDGDGAPDLLSRGTGGYLVIHR